MLHSRFEDFDLYSYFAHLVDQIPEGKVTSFKEIAQALGDPVAALAAAYMQRILRGSIHPVHRIVSLNGKLGGYRSTDTIRSDSELLRNEGVYVTSGSVLDFSSINFNDFDTYFPLASMREEQDRYSKEVSLEDDFDPDTIGGVDVSYDDWTGYACFVRTEDKDYIKSESVKKLRFPYIPGYLFYREYPFIRGLAGKFQGTLLLDGNGILHPRYFGLASSAGVFMGNATIGVAKSLLLGSVKNNRVLYGGREVGYIMNRRTIVGPGHKITLESSIRLIGNLYGRNYPGILRIAHNGTVSLRKKATMLEGEQ